MYRIVISVRDAQLFLLLRHLLAREGFETVLAQCSADIEASLSPDIVAFLIEAPTGSHDATSLVAVVRTSCPDAAVIMLRRGEVARTELDAEFVLEPPFEPAKLLEFLRSLRLHGMSHNRSDLLGFDDLTMDLSSMVVRRGKCKVHLSALQYRILRLLLEDPGSSGTARLSSPRVGHRASRSSHGRLIFISAISVGHLKHAGRISSAQ